MFLAFFSFLLIHWVKKKIPCFFDKCWGASMQPKTLFEGGIHNIKMTCYWAWIKIHMVVILSEYLLYLNCWQLFYKLLSWKKGVRQLWLAAASSMKKDMNFEVKAHNLNPLIQRHLHTLREKDRDMEYGWDCIMYSLRHKNTLTHAWYT